MGVGDAKRPVMSMSQSERKLVISRQVISPTRGCYRWFFNNYLWSKNNKSSFEKCEYYVTDWLGFKIMLLKDRNIYL